MRITESVSFWIIVISALIGLFIGSFTHWIIGVIVFVLLAGKAAMIGLILDTISGSLSYHHDRQDLRMKKTMESLRYLNATRDRTMPVQNCASKIINIRR
jgi:hypothetical protein